MIFFKKKKPMSVFPKIEKEQREIFIKGIWRPHKILIELLRLEQPLFITVVPRINNISHEEYMVIE